MPPNDTPKPAPPPDEAPPPPASLLILASPAPPPQEKPPDPWEWVQGVIYQRFGLAGLIIVAVIVLVWSNWSTVRDLPGVTTIRTWFSQAPLPKADPKRFAVALAHFEYDQDQQHERFIRESLKGFEGVQLLQFDRPISLAGTQPEESEKQGHTWATVARRLRGAGVDFGIWCYVRMAKVLPASTGPRCMQVKGPRNHINRIISNCQTFFGTTWR